MPQVRATPIQYQGQQPNANPFPKVIYGGVVSAFGNNIYGIRRAGFVAQATTTDQAIISPNGTCGSGLATPTSFVLPFDTQQAVDSYGLTIPGGPGEPDATQKNLFTQNVGPSATTTIMGWKTTKGAGGRKLPYQTDSQQGDGITLDDYGTYDRILPTGSTYTAPGSKDAIVTLPRYRVRLATVDGVDESYLEFTGDADPVYQNKGMAVAITKLEAKLKADGFGSGGGSGTGAAIYSLSANFDVAPDDVTHYIGWDHFDTGDDVYLDASNTDGLTIPVSGDGDYEVNSAFPIQFQGAPLGTGWSVEYWLSIELWRGGVQQWQYIKQDLYQETADAQHFNVHVLDISTAVPAAQSGDVVKIGLSLEPSSGLTLTPYVWGNGPNSWISIAPVGGGGASAGSCRTALAAPQTIPDSTDTVLSWSSADFASPSSMWSASTPTRITVPSDGVYLLNAYARFDAATGQEQTARISIYINGTKAAQFIDDNVVIETIGFEVGGSLPAQLTAGDYIEAFVYQSSGSAQTVGSDVPTYLSAVKLA